MAWKDELNLIEATVKQDSLNSLLEVISQVEYAVAGEKWTVVLGNQVAANDVLFLENMIKINQWGVKVSIQDDGLILDINLVFKCNLSFSFRSLEKISVSIQEFSFEKQEVQSSSPWVGFLVNFVLEVAARFLKLVHGIDIPMIPLPPLPFDIELKSLEPEFREGELDMKIGFSG